MASPIKIVSELGNLAEIIIKDQSMRYEYFMNS